MKENCFANTHKYIKQVYDCLLQEEKDVRQPFKAEKINRRDLFDTLLICEKQLQFGKEPYKI